MPPNVKEVVFYSDSCGGQNRNRYIASLLMFAVITIPAIYVIDLKFLETGHTQMEVDSMHGCIETAKKNICIYSPLEWATIIKMAKRKNPYTLLLRIFSTGKN